MGPGIKGIEFLLFLVYGRKEGRMDEWKKGREGGREKEELENDLKGGGKTLLESNLT